MAQRKRLLRLTTKPDDHFLASRNERHTTQQQQQKTQTRQNASSTHSQVAPTQLTLYVHRISSFKAKIKSIGFPKDVFCRWIKNKKINGAKSKSHANPFCALWSFESLRDYSQKAHTRRQQTHIHIYIPHKTNDVQYTVQQGNVNCLS